MNRLDCNEVKKTSRLSQFFFFYFPENRFISLLHISFCLTFFVYTDFFVAFQLVQSTFEENDKFLNKFIIMVSMNGNKKWQENTKQLSMIPRSTNIETISPF